MNGLTDPASDTPWNDPVLATIVAAAAVSMLVATIWLMRRRSRDGRGAAAICLAVSVALHALLIYALPSLKRWGGGQSTLDSVVYDPGAGELTITNFDPQLEPDSAATPDSPSKAASMIAPLPVAMSIEAVPPQTASVLEATGERSDDVSARLPTALAPSRQPEADANRTEDFLSQWLSADADVVASKTQPSPGSPPPTPASIPHSVPGLSDADFAHRAGDAKRLALMATGGDENTEAAVEAALKWLAADQRPDGSWDPVSSGAGRETLTLGTDRGGAGKSATHGLTGLALLSMLGAGNTHLEGPYADSVRRGLTFLIQTQHPDGSLAGNASLYESNYCHGMAALAMCEAAAMTNDPSAMRTAGAAVRYTLAMQHPATGGWRYAKGDAGDLSQLGWQVMVMDSGRRASIAVSPHSMAAASRFLRSVRAGQHGGLACYRPGESPTRTMTAEALATRLLLDETVPANEIEEAEAFLLRQPPGVGKDNYYGWYYTSLALHQLQDDAWTRWNDAMKSRLIARQMPGGSWPTDEEWGGYGGRVYTTAMATMCLEVYYRHAIRGTELKALSAEAAPSPGTTKTR